MTSLLFILSILVSIGSLVCFIMVLIKLFQIEGVLKGLFGIICSLYTLIWGWQNVDRLGIRQVMTIWSALIVVGLLLNFAVSATAPRTAPAGFGTPGGTALPGGGVR